MERNGRIGVTLLLLGVVACGGDGESPERTARIGAGPELSEEALIERAREIHARVLTVDTHVDIPFTFATPEVDPGVRGAYQNDLPKMREGGLDAAFFIVYHGQEARTPEGYAQALQGAMRKFEGIRRMAEELHPLEIGLARSAAEVERLHGEGKLVALIGVENAYPIGEDLSLLADFQARGATYVSLTHNGHSQFGDAAVERPDLGDQGPEWGGLSPLGEAAVDELNRLGIMIDVSHAAKSTMMQMVERSRAPILASHSSIRAVADHPRNLDDEQLEAIRRKGGVAQTTALGAFVKVQPPERDQAVAELRTRVGLAAGASPDGLPADRRVQWEEGMQAIDRQFPPASLADYIDHIDYAVDRIGIDHVGISSDFDGGGGVVGWMDASETFNVTLELVRRGYTEDEIRKLWGGNLLRVLREVEETGARLRGEREPMGGH
jgi:membrane dipeptidase